MVDDQIGGPTGAAEIAQACVTIAQALKADPSHAGIYHFARTPDTSWAEFARIIFDKAGIPCAVNGIPTSDYPTPAARPLNSRMDCTKTSEVFGIKRPDWRDSLDNILAELGRKKVSYRCASA